MLIEAGGAGTALALALALADDAVLGRPRPCASALLQKKSSVPEASGYPGAVPGESRGPDVAPGAGERPGLVSERVPG